VENIFLKQLANDSTKSLVVDDLNSPLSFLQWKEESPTVPEADLSFHYNQYILNWFSKQKDKTISNKLLLRQKYLYLLQNLDLFFTNDEKSTWYNKLNLADEKELLLAIPYFAKKLKDVAIYYLNLRKQIKNAKVKYNTVGTTDSVEHEVYSYLLRALSPENVEFSPDFIGLDNVVPDIKKELVVKVDELYDDGQYFDHSPTTPVSAYVNVLDQATAAFFQTKGIVLSSSEWMFNSLTLPVTADLNSLVNRLTGDVFETSDTTQYSDFIQKYLAENKSLITFSTPISSYNVSSIQLSAGNNRFFYPANTIDSSLTVPTQIVPIPLSSVVLDGAAYGTSVQNADTIFVRQGGVVKGAWNRYIEYENIPETVESHISHNSKTSFVFPYPGYGLSAEDIPWTGVGFKYDEEYPFLSRELKAAVQSAYWSFSLSGNNCNSIYINNTTAVSSGATPSKAFSKSDKIYIRERNQNYDISTAFGEVSGAWLYKFNEAAIPISPNQDNVILWPYDIIDKNAEVYPPHLQKLNFDNVCDPVFIQALDTSMFFAASSFELADKIYKLNNYTDSETTSAIECAWLYSDVNNVGDYNFFRQDGACLLFPSGVATRFIWTGPNNTALSSVFVSVNHQEDCPFNTNVPSVSAYDWRKCSCKSVYYSPLGHSGFNYIDGQTDMIFEDTSTDLQPFDIGSWKDVNGNQIQDGDSVGWAWYKNSAETNGWGYGQWTTRTFVNQTSAFGGTPDPKTLRLQYGKPYIYSRSGSKINSDSFPTYSAFYKYNTSNTNWRGARYDVVSTGWVGLNTLSNMIFNPGDFIKVSRQPSTTFTYLSTYNIDVKSSNENSIWASYDKIVL